MSNVVPSYMPAANEIAYHVREILILIGENDERPGLLDTPSRVARMYLELFSTVGEDGPELTAFPNEEAYSELIVERDIVVQSMCEHHLIPFVGKAHIGYIPNDKYLGLSKLVRVVQHFCKRPQVQERLTHDIADYIFEKLEPLGLMVVVEAEHMCMSLRGVKEPGITTITAAICEQEGFEFPKDEFQTYVGMGGSKPR